jgi:formate dehydrogenase major subunit
MLRKKTNGAANGSRMSKTLVGLTGGVLDRRTFLNRSGLAAGGIAAASLAGGGMVTKARAQTQAAAGAVQQIKSVCTHCSVGCTVIAEVENGVWVGQEPGFDSPFNLGAHCAKGASVREHGHGERRLKYPMKLVDGQYQRISWQQAIDEVGDQLIAIRDANGPDAGFWMGGSKHSNEGAYL